jgi:hypothetical protein
MVRGCGAAFDPEEWPDNPDSDVAEVKTWLTRIATVSSSG